MMVAMLRRDERRRATDSRRGPGFRPFARWADRASGLPGRGNVRTVAATDAESRGNILTTGVRLSRSCAFRRGGRTSHLPWHVPNRIPATASLRSTFTAAPRRPCPEGVNERIPSRSHRGPGWAATRMTVGGEEASGNHLVVRWEAIHDVRPGTESHARGLGQRRRGLVGEAGFSGSFELRADPLRRDAPAGSRDANHWIRRHVDRPGVTSLPMARTSCSGRSESPDTCTSFGGCRIGSR